MAWSVIKLGKLLNIQNGYAFDSKKFVDQGGVPLIRIRDISDGYNTVVNYEGDYDDKYLVKNGDFLIGMDGEFRCYEWKGQNSLLNQRVCRLEGFDNSLYSRFLFYGINKYLKDIEDVTAFTTVKHISAKQIKDIEFPIPPIQEQKRIVVILDQAFADIDKARTLTEQNLKNARELFDSYLQRLFDALGSESEIRSMSDVSILSMIDGDRGKNYPKKSDFLKDGHCLFLSTKNVRPDGFLFDEIMFIDEERDNLLRKGKLRRNDVVMTTRGTIGNLALFDESVEFDNIRINSGMLILRPNIEAIYPSYLFEILRSGIVKRQIEQKVSGAAQPQLPIKTLNSFTFPVPKNIEAQKETVEKIKTIELNINKSLEFYKQKLCKLDELKKSLLQKAFSGELTKDKQEAA